MAQQHRNSMVITGAAGGLGSAMATVAARNGWQVVMLDKNKRGLEQCYDRIVAVGGPEPILHVLDLAMVGPNDCDSFVKALQEQVGSLNALVHCAVSFPGLQPLDLIEPQNWLEQIQVNLNAPWLLTNKLLPLLRQDTASTLVFIADGEAESRALWGAYSTSKAAIRSLAAQFNAELRSTQVRVHLVDPGPMRTPLRSSVFHSENPVTVVAPETRAKQLLSILAEGNAKREFCFSLSSEEV